MIRRYRVRVIAKNRKKGIYVLSPSFVSQLEDAFQKSQWGGIRKEYRKGRGKHVKHPLKGLPVVSPFFRLRIGRYLLPNVRMDRSVTIPKSVVKRYGIDKRKYVFVTVDTEGLSTRVPTHHKMVSNTVSVQQCLGFHLSESIYPDVVLEKVMRFVREKYNYQLAVVKRSNFMYYRRYFIRLFYVARLKGSAESQYFAVTLATRGVLENKKSTIEQTIDELEREFWRMCVTLDNYEEYDWWAFVGVCYYETDVYSKSITRHRGVLRRIVEMFR